MIALLRKDSGDGVPLVYVPGIDGSGDMLMETADRLERRFRLVRLRYTHDGEDSYTFLASSIDRLLGELGLERVVVLCESFGGGVALHLALNHPRRVAGLAIVNGFAYHPWRIRLWISRLASPILQGTLFRICRRLVSPFALFGGRESKEVRKRFRTVGGEGIDASYRKRLEMIQGLDLRPRLGELQAPLALYASDSDRIVPSLRAMREVHSLVPTSTFEVLKDAGHLVLPLPEEPWVERMIELTERSDL